MKFVFFLSVFIVCYTYIGYGLVLFVLVKIKQAWKGKRKIPQVPEKDLPSCTLVVAAYNEEDYITEKIKNTLELSYPDGKLQLLFITDGSTDHTPAMIAAYEQIRLMHTDARQGKIAAVHRAVQEVETDVIVFTDANTFLNRQALINICRHYADPSVGAVAGEKRIFTDTAADASSAGEGFYWKYESKLKAWDSELHSVVGAAGELFSIKRGLYEPVSSRAIIDDFMISMRIAQKGYRIVYEPEAFAIEHASENVSEELKRKIRIAAGGLQSVIWLKPLLNIFRYGTLSFQYISHRVLRWTVTPFFLILAFISNLFLALYTNSLFYHLLFYCQVFFYLLSILGYLLEKRSIRIKALFIPYYFCIMNYAVIAGIIRYFRNRQSSAWEKSKRKTEIPR